MHPSSNRYGASQPVDFDGSQSRRHGRVPALAILKVLVFVFNLALSATRWNAFAACVEYAGAAMYGDPECWRSRWRRKIRSACAPPAGNPSAAVQSCWRQARAQPYRLTRP